MVLERKFLQQILAYVSLCVFLMCKIPCMFVGRNWLGLCCLSLVGLCLLYRPCLCLIWKEKYDVRGAYDHNNRFTMLIIVVWIET